MRPQLHKTTLRRRIAFWSACATLLVAPYVVAEDHVNDEYFITGIASYATTGAKRFEDSAALGFGAGYRYAQYFADVGIDRLGSFKLRLNDDASVDLNAVRLAGGMRTELIEQLYFDAAIGALFWRGKSRYQGKTWDKDSGVTQLLSASVAQRVQIFEFGLRAQYAPRVAGENYRVAGVFISVRFPRNDEPAHVAP